MDDFEFVACRRSAKLVKYYGTAEQVVIPAFFEGKPVAEIGTGAFASNYGIISVILPKNNIERIEVNAFGWARKLAYIGVEVPTGDETPAESVLPASVRYIGANAFDWNFFIKKLTILGEAVEIDEYAFASSNIEEIFMPNCTALRLGTGAFIHCVKLKRVIAPKADTSMIPSCCFEGCLELQQVDMRFSAVGHHAFHGCRELYRIRLPKVLTYAEPRAFEGCTLLAGKRSYIK